MTPIEKLINSAMRELGTIDNGVSKKVAEQIEPMIEDMMANKATTLSVTAQLLEGMVANPLLSPKLETPNGQDEIIRLAENMADKMLARMKKKELH